VWDGRLLGLGFVKGADVYRGRVEARPELSCSLPFCFSGVFDRGLLLIS
jgi:hypothetical protein